MTISLFHQKAKTAAVIKAIPPKIYKTWFKLRFFKSWILNFGSFISFILTLGESNKNGQIFRRSLNAQLFLRLFSYIFYPFDDKRCEYSEIHLSRLMAEDDRQ